MRAFPEPEIKSRECIADVVDGQTARIRIEITHLAREGAAHIQIQHQRLQGPGRQSDRTQEVKMNHGEDGGDRDLRTGAQQRSGQSLSFPNLQMERAAPTIAANEKFGSVDGIVGGRERLPVELASRARKVRRPDIRLVIRERKRVRLGQYAQTHRKGRDVL